MKVAFLTDVHIGARNNSQFYLDNLLKFFNENFFPNLIKHKIKDVIILGDLFERRKDINFNVLHQAKVNIFDVLEQLGIAVRIIYGNHDIYFRNTSEVNSIDLLLSGYRNIEIVNNHKVFDFNGYKVGLIGWIHSGNYESSVEWINTVETDLLGGHFEIKSFEVVKGHRSETGFDTSMFSRFEYVLSGHFHIPATNGNISYIGNTNQTNWGDYNIKKGFTVLDTTKRKLSFVENTFTVYEIIEFNDSVDIVSFNYDRYKDKIVRIQVQSLDNINKKVFDLFVDKLTTLVYSIDIQEQLDRARNSCDTIEIDTDSISNNMEMINLYISGFENDKIDKSRLKDYFAKIYQDSVLQSGKE